MARLWHKGKPSMKKTALISEGGVLSGRLASRLAEIHGSGFFHHETAPRPDDSLLSGLDELWYIRHPSLSLTENEKSIADLLAYVRVHQIPVINHVSSIFRAGDRDLFEGRSAPAVPVCKPAEVCHPYNEAVLRSSGSRLRAFHLPILLDEPSHAWLQFLRCLLRFRDEIEDRISGYFKTNPLRVNLSPGIAPMLSATEAAQAMVETSRHPVEGNECFHILNPHSVSLESYFPALEQATGVRLICAQKQALDTIDQLFGRYIDEFLPYLQTERAFSCDQALTCSPSLRVHDIDLRGTVVSGIAACQAEEDHRDQARSCIYSMLEKRQVCLPDGTELNYYAGGKGARPLVILNAFGQGFGYWTKFLAEVFDDYKFILWLPRGNDFESVGLQASSSLTVHVDDLQAVLDQEKICSCNLLAWCTGPKLALEYFLKYPKTVASMVFVAGSFKGLAEHRSLETTYEKGLESLLGMVQQQPKMAGLMIEALKNVLLAQGTQPGKDPESSAGPPQRELLSSVNTSLKDMVLEPFHSSETVFAYANQLRHFWDSNFVTLLNHIEAPVLFVGGDCDRIASQEISKRVALSMPQARYAEVTGGSHYIQHSCPDLLAGIMKKFIEDGLQFSFHHPWIRISAVRADGSTRRRDDRKDNERGEDQGDVSGHEPAAVPSHGAAVC
jgi:pimeloyl-ACP methyl ester carboxylesterase